MQQALHHFQAYKQWLIYNILKFSNKSISFPLNTS